jgi:hypothetical protein
MISALLLLAGLGAGAGYIYTAPEFERVKPEVEGPQNLFWNRKSPLVIKLKDNTGLKRYELILSDGAKSVIVGQGVFSDKPREQPLLVNYPKGKVLNPRAKQFTLKVKVTDSSMWNFMAGNSAEKMFRVNIDYKRPNVNILSNSRMINQGGSALVVFQAEDENMNALYVLANKHKFKPVFI